VPVCSQHNSEPLRLHAQGSVHQVVPSTDQRSGAGYERSGPFVAYVSGRGHKGHNWPACSPLTSSRQHLGQPDPSSGRAPRISTPSPYSWGAEHRKTKGCCYSSQYLHRKYNVVQHLPQHPQQRRRMEVEVQENTRPGWIGGGL